MISNVVFTGREAMLGQVKSARRLAAEVAQQIENAYTGVGKNFSKTEIKNAAELEKNAKFLNDSSTMPDRIASYEAAHQPIPTPVVSMPKTVNVEHIDFFA